MGLFIKFAVLLCIAHAHVISSNSLSEFKLKSDKSRPNLFVTFHIRNKNITDYVQMLQSTLFQRSPQFQPFFQPIPSLHITLVLTRAVDTDLLRVKKAFYSAIKKFNNAAKQPFRVPFDGIGQFSKTLFLRVNKNDSEIQKLYDTLSDEFTRYNLPLIGRFPTYTPHMTVVELNYASQNLSRYWQDLLKNKFDAVEVVQQLEVCRMHLNQTTKDYNVVFQKRL